MIETGWIIPFGAEAAPTERAGIVEAGGKGANLLRMAQAGIPVPEGFVVSTDAYRAYVQFNGLQGHINAAVAELETSGGENITALEAVSLRIAGCFAQGTMPEPLQEQILSAYRKMDTPAVAVRSSATAEDLPDMSFAGQQDTYLNVVGEDALLQAVVRCWASLWTARAIGYRTRNKVSNEGAALAVVVQRMVESEVSGVLFTANPLTGSRSEIVIDAAYGLGEAIVSGQVEPDHYVVRIAERQIHSIVLGAKVLSIHGNIAGGTARIEEDRREKQALGDPQILDLATLGKRVADLYGAPQDIEWGFANGRFSILQSRPITSLYPDLFGVPARPLKIFLSFASVQGMLDPITPLGRYILYMLFAEAGRLYGYRFRPETQQGFFTAGERLWINITTPLRNKLGRKIIRGALDFVEPTVQRAVVSLLDEPEMQTGRALFSARALMHILRFIGLAWWNLALNVIAPERRRAQIVDLGERMLADLRNKAEQIAADHSTNTREKLIRQADLLPEFFENGLPQLFLRFVSIVATGMASFNLVRVLANKLPESINGGVNNGWSRLALEVVRGLPNNPTTEMDLALWEIALEIRADADLYKTIQQGPKMLADQYRSGRLPEGMRDRLGLFLERYGGRGLAEIDMGRARWSEDPEHIFEVLAGYLHINDDFQAPDAVFARGAKAAEHAIHQLASGLRQTHWGWLKTRLLRFAAHRVRALIGARESPKFFAVRMMNIVRQELLTSGDALVKEGGLEQKDDLFYLTLPEIKAFASGRPEDWREEIRRRREAYRRELGRRQIPRLLVSDGRAFYEGMAGSEESGKSLAGSPVSPGIVEGLIRVVLDPRQSNLRPGEIMVCPGTDPSWTPLFLTAAGLVMEVGGMMTHGAVVAREYGLPAVVGVDQATRKLITGQRIRLNGSTGRIDLLEDEAVEQSGPELTRGIITTRD